MRVLITGGAGFIGSHLARACLARGDTVSVIDDLSTGVQSAVPPGARWIQGDVRDPEVVRPAVEAADLVVHLAAAVGPALVARDPAGTWSRNVDGTSCVLDAATSVGSRVIIASTSEVYGDLARDPHRAGRGLAEDEPVRVRADGRRDVYAISKLAAEAYAFAVHRTHLLPVTVVRPFNVVGPAQSSRYGMVLARFAEAAALGRPLPVYGDGRQRRCFLHVHDAVRALLALAECVRAEGVVVNLGSDEEVAISDLAVRVCRVADIPLSVRHVPFEQVYGEGFVDPALRRPDLSRLHDLIAFVPERSLDDAIKDAVGVARSRLGVAAQRPRTQR